VVDELTAMYLNVGSLVKDACAVVGVVSKFLEHFIISRFCNTLLQTYKHKNFNLLSC
jgi:hypothetical protein